MDATWSERLDLFRFALAAAACAGIVCPLVGAFLFVRRTSFYGITLPQFATAGVVCGFVALPWWAAHIGLGGIDVDVALTDSHAAMNYHLAWAAAFTFGGLVALVLWSRKGGSEVGRVAAAFAIANAATYLLGRASPIGKSLVDELLQGEILGVGLHEFETLAVAFALVLAVLLVYQRDFLIVSYDRESARVLGKRVVAFETLLTAATGITIAVGTMTLGPTLVFGLLVLPPLAARNWARSMPAFLALSALFGTAAVIGGIVASFELDLPLGAAIVGVAALLLLVRRWRG
ncbi:MAG: metal ABC transporter permease [Planctomycetota bacterium]